MVSGTNDTATTEILPGLASLEYNASCPRIARFLLAHTLGDHKLSVHKVGNMTWDGTARLGMSGKDHL